MRGGCRGLRRVAGARDRVMWRIVAQLVERRPDKAEVDGPNPSGPTVEEWPSGRWHPVRTRKVERPASSNLASSSGSVAEWPMAAAR